MPTPILKPRIVLIEDDEGRIEIFSRWLANSEFVLVVARSGGQALGMLSHGFDSVAGLMLDHDLSNSPMTAADYSLSASNLIPLIQRTLPRHVPVLIHSHNLTKPEAMQRALRSTGFSVTRTPFAKLVGDASLFASWLDEVRDNLDL